MKYAKHLLLAGFAFLALAGCKDDEDSVNINPALLVGDWEPIELYCDDGEAVTNALGLEIKATYSFEGTDFNATLTFTDNPNRYSSSGSLTYDITTTVQGTTETESLTVSDFFGSGEWEINGDVITQFPDDGSPAQSTKILELSEDKLRLRFDQDITEEELGIEVHSTATVFATFVPK